MQLLLLWESNKYYVFILCVFSLRYAAPEAYVPYYIAMWPVSFYHIFPLYLINGKIFGIKGIEHKSVF